jgi:RNase P/RNase MRP subunit POP5
MLLVELTKGFKMVFHARVIIRKLRVSGTANGVRSGHDSSPPRKHVLIK